MKTKTIAVNDIAPARVRLFWATKNAANWQGILGHRPHAPRDQSNWRSYQPDVIAGFDSSRFTHFCFFRVTSNGILRITSTRLVSLQTKQERGGRCSQRTRREATPAVFFMSRRPPCRHQWILNKTSRLTPHVQVQQRR